jgi:branched-chain amino acid transport system substrate-binding protein
MKQRFLPALALGLGLLCISAMAQSGKPIVIGLTTPTSGNAASFADPERRGVEMAVQEINAAGGVLGRPLQLVVADNRCNPTEGVHSANKLINDDKAVALIGAFCSSVSLAVMPVVRRAEVPLVIDVSTAPAISERIGKGKNTWVFRTSVTDDGMARALIDHLASKTAWRKIALIAEDTDYGRGGVGAFNELAKAKGIGIVATEMVQPATADFTSAITKLAAAKPDAIALYVLGADMANFLKQYQAWGGKIPVTGRFDPGLLSPEQRAAGFLDGSIGVLPYSPEIDTPANRRFVAGYRERNSADPQFQSAYGYEAVFLIADTIKRTGKAEPAAIREALASSRMDSMVGTPITFDAQHQAHNNAVILQLKGGKISIISLNPT